MAIKTIRLAEAFPGAGFDTNHAQKHLLANAGASYLRACAAIVAGRETFGVNLHVELPLMHLAIELLAKALAAGADDAFRSRTYRHRTHKIVEAYADRVDLFAVLLKEPRTVELVRALESTWEPVRYGEAFVEYTGQDYEAAGALGVRLGDEHFRLTGTPIMAHHFPVKRP